MQNFWQLIQQLPQILQLVCALLMSISVVCTALAALLALVPQTRGAAAVLITLGTDIVGFVAKLRSFFGGSGAQKTERDPKENNGKPFFPGGGSAALILVLALPALQGCGTTVHDTIEKALVFEATAQTAQAQLLAVANAAITALPADKQADARAKLNEANQHLTDAFNAKDDALQQALAASDVSNLNLGQITSDVIQAIQAIVALVQTFGVNEQVTTPIQARLLASQAKVLAR